MDSATVLGILYAAAPVVFVLLIVLSRRARRHGGTLRAGVVGAIPLRRQIRDGGGVGRWPVLVRKIKELGRDFRRYSTQDVRSIKSSTLIMMGDRDGVRRDPAVEAGEGVGDPDTIPRPTGLQGEEEGQQVSR